VNPTITNPYEIPQGVATDAPYAADDIDNPYFDRARTEPAPDLDAHAPVLRNSEAQRLNRKALSFLGGTIALLLLMATWLFANARDSGSKKPEKQAAEAITVPDLPQSAAGADANAALPAAQPIDVQRYGAEADAADGIPPLPPADPMPRRAGRYAALGADGYGEAAAARPRPMTLLERRMGPVDPAMADGAASDPYGQAGMQMGPNGPIPAAQHAPAPAVAKVSGARFIEHPDALLVRGTYIRCVLETHIVTDVPGFTSCIVTEPVYSINGRSLLLPRGSKVLGRYQDSPTGPRVSVVWDRITTPNGLDVNMASPGVDGLGGAGHPGAYDAHWGSRISSALMISLLSDAFKYAAAKNGPPTAVINGNTVVEQPFESNTANTVQSLADQALAASAARRPTVTINQGTVVDVYVAQDIDFSNVLARR
jgi:type IV secretion system protein VirB10